MSFQTSALILAWIAIMILAFAMSGLLRQLHVIRAALDPQRRVTLGPATGAVAPPIDGIGANGWPRPTVLLFMERGCPTCRAIQDELTGVAGDELDLIVVFPEDAEGAVPEGVRIVSGQPDAFRDFGIAFTPFVVAVGPDGRVTASQPLGSVNSLRTFLGSQRERMVST